MSQSFKKNNYKKKVSSRKGFSLVETLVAIFILALAISSAMAAVQGSLMSSFFARDRTTAFFLAQEAVEIIKSKRSENGIANYSGGDVRWLDEIADWDTYGGPCGSSSDCGVDSLNYQIIDCGPSNDDCLLRKNTDGIFNHQSGDPTKFTRKIRMEEGEEDPNEAKIIVTVEWKQGIANKTFEVEEYILNWHPLSGLEE